MAIDRFNKAEFEAALPVGRWEALGIIQGEYTYAIVPSDAPAGYGILVRSSIGESGVADDCGEDSIRIHLAKKDGDEWRYIGNKSKRWVTRVNGWQRRLMESLTHAKQQLSRVRPCPLCAAELVPFTSHKAESKGRAFVSCRNEKCGKFFEWCDEAPKQVNSPTAKVPTPSTPATQAPNCPKCNSVTVRMASNKGYRCACPGNRWENGRWSICDGVIWDNSKPANLEAPALSATENTLRRLLSEAAALLGKMPDTEKTAIALVDKIDGDEAAGLVNFLINVGNLQAERASYKKR
jgi:transcription elongation factor Elf1